MTTQKKTCGCCVHLTACEITFGLVVRGHPTPKIDRPTRPIRGSSTKCRYDPSRWADAGDVLAWGWGRVIA